MLARLATALILSGAAKGSGGERTSTCSIERKMSGLSVEDFRSSSKGSLPVIFSRGNASAFAAAVARERLLETHGRREVVLAASNSYSSLKKHDLDLRAYVETYVDVATRLEDLTDTSALDSWYLFGDSPRETFGDLISLYDLPLDSAKDEGLPVLGIGGAGSGVQFHTHGAAFAESVVGAKRWFVSPPTRKPAFSSDEPTLRWAAAFDAAGGAARSANNSAVLECVVGAGEVIYVPPNWWHATLNLGVYNVFVSTFTRES